MLDAWRARGADRIDPVRFRFIEAMARRTAGQQGDARRLLEDRLAGLLAAYGERVAAGEQAADSMAPPAAVAIAIATQQQQQSQPPRGALAELVEHLGRVSAHGDGPAPGDAVASLTPSGEEKTLRYFRNTWSRLSAERRVTQSLAKVPENAGPLNSHHLVHRSLTLMRDLSPEYLNRFMSYVDTLLWIDQVNSSGAAAPAGANAPRAESGKKTARAKPG
ncbi:DUF2894 domain-containing protein [Variovorax sp. KBW07]|nr:DUF2894 domain-containing protein [Variovorax sp. KBW07]